MFRKAILYSISPFAMLANKINWRFGRPYRRNYEFVKPHIQRFAPGMIILSHKDYELTNLFIGGYWTHVAIIVSQNEVIEAISKGVVKTNTKKFFSTLFWNRNSATVAQCKKQSITQTVMSAIHIISNFCQVKDHLPALTLYTVLIPYQSITRKTGH